MTSLIDIGRHISRKRQRLGLRQIDLAKRAGLSRATLEALENGRAKDIRWLNLTRILNALDLEMIVQPIQLAEPTLERLMAEASDD